jgi:hypothetical protein
MEVKGIIHDDNVSDVIIRGRGGGFDWRSLYPLSGLL